MIFKAFYSQQLKRQAVKRLDLKKQQKEDLIAELHPHISKWTI